MGCFQSTEEKELKKANDEINKNLKKDEETFRSEVKMLLLGAGESGKSTILKQMQLIHGAGYTKEERKTYRTIIFSNTLQSMRALLQAMAKLDIAIGDPASNDRHKAVVLETTEAGDVFAKDLVEAIRALWSDSGVQECFTRSREYQLNDSAKYYFDEIDRIAAPDYLPTDQDILRSRVKTTGITETTFRVKDLTYRMFDVGGQRSERKKWIHCFEDVTAVVFLVAISEYDQVLVEDETTNRMQEALTLFDSICNSKWFVKTSMILFLNKIDLFKQKLLTSPLSQYFSDYTGGDSYDSASEYIAEKFVGLNKSPEKRVYTHFTCATDTSQVAFVMNAVHDIIVQQNLKLAGLI